MMTTYTWNGTQGSWFDPSNWVTYVVDPTTGESVAVHAVPVAGDTVQSPSVIIGSDTLTLTGINFSGFYNIFYGSGEINLKGNTTIENQFNYNPDLSYTEFLVGGGSNVSNFGTLTLDMPYGITFGQNDQDTGSGSFSNEMGATLDLQSDGGIIRSNNGDGQTFYNKGIIVKIGTGGGGIYTASDLYALFINTGSLQINTGTLSFLGGGTSDASAFTVDADATVDFSGGSNDTFTLTGGTYDIAGTTAVSGGIADFSAATIVSLGSQLSVDGGTLDLGAQDASAASLSQIGGTVTGSGTLAVTGDALFSGSEYQTGSGTTILSGTSVFLPGYQGAIYNSYIPYSVYLDGGRIFENAGTFEVQGAGGIELGAVFPFGPNPIGGGTLKNDAGAIFDMEADGTAVYGGSGTTAFENAGLVEKTAGTGSSNITTSFVNTGTVLVKTGILSFGGGGTSDASAFAVDADATLDFYGSSTFTLSVRL